MIETHSQHLQKLNVWTRILGDRVFGLFFIDGNLTAEKNIKTCCEMRLWQYSR